MPEPEVTAPEAAEEPNPQIKEIQEKVAEITEPPKGEEVAEIDDPSKYEGLGGKPTFKTKKSADERIGEITKSYRTEERKNVELEKKLKEAEDKMAGMIANPPAREPPKKEEPPPPPVEPPEKENKVDAELDALWEEHKKASEDMEGGKASDIFKKIHTLESKRLKEAATIKPEYIDKAIREKEEKRAAEQFRKNNTWFSSDAKQGASNPDYNMDKSNYAIAVEQSLLSTFKGTFPELLKEVENRVDKLFNPKAVVKRPGLANVSSVNAMKNHTSADNITLTPFQKSFCEKANMKEEDYKAELKKMERK